MDKKRRIGSYIVSFDTFLLLPVVKGNKISTRVIERNGELNVPRKPIHIVKKSCNYYGGSLQNSTNTAKLAIGKRHKTPIIIAHDFGVPYIFLPTMSPNSEQNSWVSYSAIDNIEPDNLGCTLYLENGLTLKFDISATTMFRQFAVATLLEKNFLKKQRQLNRPSNFDFPDED
ncbi:competence protein ComK [Sporosarcina sp. E16_3]|uniref:competence protein ComK n=1 Tax=Sporosarcina sp. E16_3 TaxID=2789293 RepID=UPI001A92D57D|nr:competence protein ComK [Sporosarcina sp. E16_3]MBO0603362.1 competence protein ComK [Sporosarcina sp. E16_3]